MLNWNRTWSFSDTMNRFCTGISTAFAALSLGELGWQFLFHANAPILQLFVMLLVAAFGSVLGINARVSDRIISTMHRALQVARWLVVVALIVLGGILGYFLTVGFPLDFFTIIGILAGGLVATLLVTRVNQI